MNKRRILGAVLIVVGLVTALNGWAAVWGVIDGLFASVTGGSAVITVVDAEGRPVAGAEVTVLDVLYLGYNITLNTPLDPTDSRGRTSFSTSLAGTYRIEARKTGYRPGRVFVSIGVGDREQATIVLEVEEELSGRWWINGVEITSPDQVVRLETSTVAFKFTATGEVSSVTVSWNGTESGSLGLTRQDDLWVGSTELRDGTYTVTLTAEGPSGTLTLSLTGLEAETPVTRWAVDAGLVAVGCVLMLPERKKRRKGKR